MEVTLHAIGSLSVCARVIKTVFPAIHGQEGLWAEGEGTWVRCIHSLHQDHLDRFATTYANKEKADNQTQWKLFMKMCYS